MAETLGIETSLPPSELRGNSRAHYMVKYRASNQAKNDGYALGCYYAITRTDLNQFSKARITFAFHHNRKIDLDNLAIGMKPFIDGLVISHLIEDDGPDQVVYGEHSFEKCPKGESKTIVTIEQLA